MKKLYKKYFGELLLILASLSYSFEWYFVRKLYESDYNSLDITFIRIFITVLIIGLFFLIFNRKFFQNKIIGIKNWGLIFVLVFIAIFANIFFNKAIELTSVSNVLITVYLSVFWAYIVGVFLFKEKVNLLKIFYIFLAFVGIILALLGNGSFIGLNLGYGELFALFVSFGMALAVVIRKKLSSISGFYSVFITFTLVSLILFIFILSYFGIDYLYKFLNKDFLIYGGLLALTAGVLGRGLKEVGTKYVPVSLVLIIMLLEPIFQMTTAYFIAGETLSFINLLGILLVFCMIVLISKKK